MYLPHTVGVRRTGLLLFVAFWFCIAVPSSLAPSPSSSFRSAIRYVEARSRKNATTNTSTGTLSESLSFTLSTSKLQPRTRSSLTLSQTESLTKRLIATHTQSTLTTTQSLTKRLIATHTQSTLTTTPSSSGSQSQSRPPKKKKTRTVTATPSPTMSQSHIPKKKKTRTVTATPSPSTSASPSQSLSRLPKKTRTQTFSMSMSASASASASQSPSSSSSTSQSTSTSQSSTMSSSTSMSTSASPSTSPSPSATATITASKPKKPTRTPSPSPTHSDTASISMSPSVTPPPTATPSPSTSMSFSTSTSLSQSSSPSSSTSASSSVSTSASASTSTSESQTASPSLTSSASVSTSASPSTSPSAPSASQSKTPTLTPPPTATPSPSISISTSTTTSKSSSASTSTSLSTSQSSSVSTSVSTSSSSSQSASVSDSQSSSRSRSVSASYSVSTSDSPSGSVSQTASGSITHQPPPTRTMSGTPTQSTSVTSTVSTSQSTSTSQSVSVSVSQSASVSGSASISGTMSDPDGFSDTRSRQKTMSVMLTMTKGTMTYSSSQSSSSTATLTKGIPPTRTASSTWTTSVTMSASTSRTGTRTMPLTTSKMPPTTTPVPTPSMTMMTRCPLNCMNGDCNNQYPFFCKCYSNSVKGYWAGSDKGGPCQICLTGYYGARCTLSCPGGTCSMCSGHGTCNDGVDGTGACVCYNSTQRGFWAGKSCANCQTGYWGTSCKNVCLCNQVHGTCNGDRFGDGTCTCDTGYLLPYCYECNPNIIVGCVNEIKCPGTTPCSGHGTCVPVAALTGICSCAPFFATPDCSVQCPNNCSSQGRCSDGAAGTGLCSCNTSFAPPDCANCVYGYYGPTCTQPCPNGATNPCTKHGTCLRDGTCRCDDGYQGFACQIPCPVGLNGMYCGGNGTCDFNGNCVCNRNATAGYWDGTACDNCLTGYGGRLCNSQCPVNASGAICSGASRGTCNVTTGKCACITNVTCGLACEVDVLITGECRTCPTTEVYGPNCEFSCVCFNGATCDHGKTGTGQCYCTTGWSGAHCNITCPGGVATPCSNNGNCDQYSSLCVCNPNFGGELCQYACPADCTLHGWCNDTRLGDGTCHCNHNWVWPATGCTLFCNCSDSGHCPLGDSACQCDAGYNGTHCEACIDGFCGWNCTLPCDQGTTVGRSCKCFTGYGGAQCDTTCPLGDNGIICSGQGDCLQDLTCSCWVGYKGPSCQCSPLHKTTADHCTTCIDTRYGPDCLSPCLCSGRGLCDSNGVCTCAANNVTGYWAGDHCDVCASGFMGVKCSQKSVATTILAPLTYVSDIMISNLYSTLWPEKSMYLVGGQIFNAIFNVTTMTPNMISQATIQEVCAIGGGDVQNVWPVPNPATVGTANGSAITPPGSTVVRNDSSWDQQLYYLTQINGTCITVTPSISVGNYQTPLQGLQRVSSDLMDRTSTVALSNSLLIPKYNRMCAVAANIRGLFCHVIGGDTPSSFIQTSFRESRTVAWSKALDAVYIAGQRQASVATCDVEYYRVNGSLSVAGTITPAPYDILTELGYIGLSCTTMDCTTEVDGIMYFAATTSNGTYLAAINLTVTNASHAGARLIPGAVLGGVTSRCNAIGYDPFSGIGLAVFGRNMIKYKNTPVDTQFWSTSVLQMSQYKQRTYVLPYGQQLLNSALTRTIDIYSAKQVAFAPLSAARGIEVARFLLIEVVSISPNIADRTGSTVITVTGTGFLKNTNGLALCKFDTTEVPATVLSLNTLLCVAPLSRSTSTCLTQTLEVTMDNLTYTQNQAKIDRPAPVLLQSVTPTSISLQNRTVNEVELQGHGFQDSAYATCKFIVDPSTGESLITSGTFVESRQAYLCQLPRFVKPTQPNSYIALSLDGQVYSPSTLPFAALGSPAGIVLVPPSLSIASTRNVTFGVLSVLMVDSAKNPLGVYDTQSRVANLFIDPASFPTTRAPTNTTMFTTVITTLPPTTLPPMSIRVFAGQGVNATTAAPNASSGPLNTTLVNLASTAPPSGSAYLYNADPVVMTQGRAIFDNPYLLRPLVGTILLDIVVGPYTNSLPVTIVPGTLFAIALQEQPVNSSIPFVPGSPLPKSVTIRALDGAGNVISPDTPILVNCTLLAFRDPQNLTNFNVTKMFNVISIRNTGTGLLSPEVVPMIFGLWYAMRFEVIGNTAINTQSDLWVPGCLPNSFQVPGTSVCQLCKPNTVCNGSNILVTNPGYWRGGLNSLDIYKCPIAKACLASASGRCNVGYHGPLCSVCEEDYGKDYARKCYSCDPLSSNMAFFCGVVLLFLVVTVMYTVLTAQNWNAAESRAGMTITVLQMLLTSIQTFSLLQYAQIVSAPPNFSKMLSGLAIVADLRFFNIQALNCMLYQVGLNESVLFLIYLGLLLFTGFVYIGSKVTVKFFPNVMLSTVARKQRERFHRLEDMAERDSGFKRPADDDEEDEDDDDAAAAGQDTTFEESAGGSDARAIAKQTAKKMAKNVKKLKKFLPWKKTRYIKEHQFKTLMLITAQILLFFIVQPICYYTFNIFVCQPVNDGTTVMNLNHQDMSIDCDSKYYANLSIVATIVSIVIAGFMPVALICLMALMKYKYEENQFRLYTTFLTQATLENRWYWIPIIWIRKVFLVLVLVMAPPILSTYLFVWTMTVFSVLVFLMKPYRVLRHNYLEAASSIMIVIVGNMMLAQDAVHAEPENLDAVALANWDSFFIIVPLLCWLLFVVEWVYIWAYLGKKMEAEEQQKEAATNDTNRKDVREIEAELRRKGRYTGEDDEEDAEEKNNKKQEGPTEALMVPMLERRKSRSKSRHRDDDDDDEEEDEWWATHTKKSMQRSDNKSQTLSAFGDAEGSPGAAKVKPAVGFRSVADMPSTVYVPKDVLLEPERVVGSIDDVNQDIDVFMGKMGLPSNGGGAATGMERANSPSTQQRAWVAPDEALDVDFPGSRDDDDDEHDMYSGYRPPEIKTPPKRPDFLDKRLRQMGMGVKTAVVTPNGDVVPLPRPPEAEEAPPVMLRDGQQSDAAPPSDAISASPSPAKPAEFSLPARPIRRLYTGATAKIITEDDL